MSWSPGRGRREHGFFLVWMAIMIVTLMATAALAIEWHNLSRAGTQAQKAADAASLGGVVYMPDEFDPEGNDVLGEDDAVGRARELAAQNGFVNGVDDTIVRVRRGPVPTQLEVCIERTVPNALDNMIGMADRTIARCAIAEYNQPLSLGSPKSWYGNNPEAPAASNPIGDPDGEYPNFWGSIGGSGAHGKRAGEPRTSLDCSFEFGIFGNLGPLDGCAADGTNHDYDPDGYFYAIDVPEGASGSLHVQMYDPAFTGIGSGCPANAAGKTSPPATPAEAEADPQVPNGGTQLSVAAGLPAVAIPGYPAGPPPSERYAPGLQPVRYCATDAYFAPGPNSPDHGNYALPWATWRLIAPDDTPNDPTDYEPGDVVCSAEFAGFRDNVAATLLQMIQQPEAYRNGTPVRFVDYFRNWFSICGSGGLGSVQPGTYYLQVTSVTKVDGSPAPTAAGHNRFSIRAGVGAATAGGVAVHGFGAMETAMVAPAGTSSFYLTEIQPSARNRELVISFWDVGDSGAATNGTITIVPPNDSGWTEFQGCLYQDPIAQFTWFEHPERPPPEGRPFLPADGCAMTGVQNNPWDAKWIRVVVPIPSEDHPTNPYTCDPAANGGTGCWLKIEFTQANGIGDTAVWEAEIDGSPARLVK